MVGGGAWFLLGDATTPTATVDEPPAVTVDRPTDEVDDAEPPSEAPTAPTVATPTARAKRLLIITSRPTGATVRAEDGTLIGTTPLTLSRRAKVTNDALLPLTILPDASERPLGTIILSREGHEDTSGDINFAFPSQDGAEGTFEVGLKALPVIDVSANRKGVTVRVRGTESVLGKTPFAWTVPTDVVRDVRATKSVSLEFLTQSEPIRVDLTVDHLDGTRALTATMPDKPKATTRTPRKRSTKPKKGWGW